MAVDTNSNFNSLLDSLKLEDPWLPPRTWESISSQSGETPHCYPPLPPLYESSPVSEASLVRSTMSAMQGVESALMSLEKIAEAFCSYPADRTFHRIPTLWNRSSSTHAVGKMLKSIGCLGSLVFLLQRFTTFFTNLDMDENSNMRRHESGNELQDHGDDSKMEKYFRNTLVNQAFAVAVRKVLEGYMRALDTLCVSIGLRRSTKGNTDSSLLKSSAIGCLTSVVHSEITFVEIYVHTKEMRTQIEVLGNICNLHESAFCFSSSSSLTDLIDKATSNFHNFYKGGDLLTYLYTKLQVADPAHCALLKFLFLRSCEPYWEFIRSWIFKAEINDPHEEFIVEFVGGQSSYPSTAGASVDFPLTSIRERNRVAVPCFLKDLLVPLLRAGQQLQVLVKLLDLCTYVASKDQSFEDFLPSWAKFSGCHSSYESGIIFNKEIMKARVLARDNYYEKLQEKLENIMTRLEFKYLQNVQEDVIPKQSSNSPLSITGVDDIFFSHLTADKRSSDKVVANDSDDSSIMDEFPYVVDAYNSSECSSVTGTEDHLEFDHIVESFDSPNALRQKHFSSLSYVTVPDGNSLQQSHQFDKMGHIKADSHIVGETTYPSNETACSPCDGRILCNPYVSFETENSDFSWNYSIKCIDGMELLPSKFGVNEIKRKAASEVGGMSQFGILADAGDSMISRIFEKNGADSDLSVSSLFSLRPWGISFHKNTFNINPMLSKNEFLKPMSRHNDLRGGLSQSLAYFDFSAVKNPCEVCIGKAELEYELPVVEGSTGPVSSCRNADFGEQSSGKIECINFYQKGVDILKDVSGGSTWGSLLCNSCKTAKDESENQILSLLTFEIPLDFIINKCLVEEVMLQYMYISKLTIKLFQDGFDLQEHLLALRRYHFMEIADWADLFIIHLWHHKWCVEEADRRLSEIQSFLDLSIQRSSCECDGKKDRLFIYVKEQSTMPLSNSASAICSFEFLGLGYRVEWPLSIILTPSAMTIYADIFSFLIQVKLAVFSLSDFWSSLKDMARLISKNHNSDMLKLDVGHLNLAMKIRHQVNHFVCTLQHYVESQVSHVSWCRFRQSLRHKVKDMMDLESVHTSYVTDSLHMCFLSEEMVFVANIIKQILQCALDFRSILTGDIWSAGVDPGRLSSKLSAINVSQLISIRQTFEKCMKELHMYYLKSSKHGDFSRFWESLNFNESRSHLLLGFLYRLGKPIHQRCNSGFPPRRHGYRTFQLHERYFWCTGNNGNVETFSIFPLHQVSSSDEN